MITAANARTRSDIYSPLNAEDSISYFVQSDVVLFVGSSSTPQPSEYAIKEEVDTQLETGGASEVDRDLSTYQLNPKAKQQSPLLSLPGELRNRVYEHVFLHEHPIDASTYDKMQDRRAATPPLLRTCHQLTIEGASIFFSKNIFAVGRARSYDTEWLEKLASEHRSLLTEVRMGHYRVYYGPTSPVRMHQLLAERGCPVEEGRLWFLEWRKLGHNFFDFFSAVSATSRKPASREDFWI